MTSVCNMFSVKWFSNKWYNIVITYHKPHTKKHQQTSICDDAALIIQTSTCDDVALIIQTSNDAALIIQTHYRVLLARRNVGCRREAIIRLQIAILKMLKTKQWDQLAHTHARLCRLKNR